MVALSRSLTSTLQNLVIKPKPHQSSLSLSKLRLSALSMPSLVIRQMLLMILDLRSKNVARKVSHCCVDEREAVNVWQWMRWAARYFAASETLCEPQIRLKIESNRSEHKRRICATFSWLFASSSAGAQPRLARVQCMIAKYLIIRFPVNASINYWMLLLEHLRFYDSISFSIIHLLFGIN